jgi:NADPH-dependent 2,4-dienoyl-CoA reductase/sulfur reductase-like enzyme
MTPATIAVLGGGYAGILAARRAAAALGPLGRVTLYADRDYFVERIRLHQVAAGQVVRTIPLPRLLGRAGFEVARVVAIDPAARAVITDRGRRTPGLRDPRAGQPHGARDPGRSSRAGPRRSRRRGGGGGGRPAGRWPRGARWRSSVAG